MPALPGQPRRSTRLARALGLDGNPLRRASDRAETWIRVGLLAVFLIAGPLVAAGAGGWAYHAGFTGSPGRAAPTSHVKAAVPQSPLAASYQGPAWAQNRRAGAASARSGEVLAAVLAPTLLALALLAALRLILVFLTRRRLAAWEAAWSRVGPQWSRGRP